MDVEALKIAAASLQGLELARVTSIAFFALTIYEWLITFDQEVEFFWNAKRSVSRTLFFLNRYVPMFIMMFAFVPFEMERPSSDLCINSIQVIFFLNIMAIGVIQAMLVLRVWHLFSNSKRVRIAIITAFVLSLFLSLILTILVVRRIEIIEDPLYYQYGGAGCRVHRPPSFWKIYFPSLILHTVLYILTAVRALKNRQLIRKNTVTKRLLRDGGSFLFVVFVSVGFSAVGSFLVDIPQINIPVFFGNFLLATTSIAMSRVMFSIHSLAARLGSETGWLLSNIELERVNWRKGNTDGEIIIERFVEDGDEPVEDPAERYRYDEEKPRSSSALGMSRIGVYNNMPWGVYKTTSHDIV